MEHAIRELFNDTLLHTALILVVLDFILGVGAALYVGTFRGAYVADFLRRDILGKVLPWGAVYVGSKIAPGADIQGIGLDVVADGLWGVLVAALGFSILSSLADFKRDSAQAVPLRDSVLQGEVPPPGTP